MRYLILIYNNPRLWEGMSHGQRVEFGLAHDALREDLAASGELVVSQALADPALGRRVSVHEGRVTSDGPFAEAKEHLAGFYLIEGDSIERAIEHAARLLEAAHGLVEVRPVMTVMPWKETVGTTETDVW